MRYRIEDRVYDTERAAETWDEELDYRDGNPISRATSSQWAHERLYRSRRGEYWLESWSDYSDTQNQARVLTSLEAATWLVNNDDVLPEDLAALEDEVLV
jgi:hypothetical protein